MDVEAVKAGGQTLDLASDLHLAGRAPSLNNNIVTLNNLDLCDVYLREGDSSRDSITLDYSYSHVNMVSLKFE